MSRMLAAAASCAVLLGVAACSDDGAKVRIDQTSAAGAGSGSLDETNLGGSGKTQQLAAAVASYKSYAVGQVAALRTATTAFTDAVRAGDLARAKELYGPSRYAWGSIRTIAALVPGVVAAVDSPAAAFASPEDPRFTGWHRLEYAVFAKGSTAGMSGVADRLDADLANLETALPKVAITPRAMVAGMQALVRPLASGAATAEPYSHTDLWGIAAALDGAQAVFRTVTPVLRARNNVLYNSLVRGFANAVATITPYRSPSGAYRAYTEVPSGVRQRLSTRCGALAADLAKVPAALGV
jgi:iron uptake system component EfeO